MRIVKIILFVVDADNPGSSLDQIFEDGAGENGYTAEEFDTQSGVDAYWKFKKE